MFACAALAAAKRRIKNLERQVLRLSKAVGHQVEYLGRFKLQLHTSLLFLCNNAVSYLCYDVLCDHVIANMLHYSILHIR